MGISIDSEEFRLRFYLIGIVSLTIGLRALNLNFQDLWIDELYSMRQSDPNIPWSTFFLNPNNLDPNPKLYTWLLRIAFTTIQYSAFVARLLSMTIGSLSIVIMYLLGCEIKDKFTGLCAALLTSVNYFNIYYSQEVRCYVLCFLLASWSYLLFLRLLKNKSKQSLFYYITVTVLLIYTHYYGILLFFAQAATICWFAVSKPDSKFMPSRKEWLGLFLVGLLSLGRIPDFTNGLRTSSFWVQPVKVSFIFDYLLEYFHGNKLILFLVFAPLIYKFYINIKTAFVHNEGSTNSSNTFTLSIYLFWIAAVIGIALLVSWLIIPCLLPRYTIIVLPAILLLISDGIQSIKNNQFKSILLVIITLVSIGDLFASSYYFTVNKTQLGVLTAYIVKSKNHYAISNERTGWYQRYYTRAMKYDMPLVEMKHSMDSILSSEQLKKSLQGFWLVGAHNEPILEKPILDSLSLNYSLVEQRAFYDCWAELFVANNNRGKGIFLILPDSTDKTHFYKSNNGEKYIALWYENAFEGDIQLDSGRYQVVIAAMGTSVGNLFPRVELKLDKKVLLKPVCNIFESESSMTFLNPISGVKHLGIKMTNDSFDREQNEDRNAFIRYILFRKIGKNE